MWINAIEIYKQMGVDPKLYTLLPVTSNLEGEYRNEEFVNIVLGVLIKNYVDAEILGRLESIYETDGWACLEELYKVFKQENDGDEYVEYAILLCSEKGYIKVDYYDSLRYFKLTEKCMDIKLYKTT